MFNFFPGMTRQRSHKQPELHQLLKRHASQPESEDTSPMSAGASGIGTYTKICLLEIGQVQMQKKKIASIMPQLIILPLLSFKPL